MGIPHWRNMLPFSWSDSQHTADHRLLRAEATLPKHIFEKSSKHVDENEIVNLTIFRNPSEE